MVGRLAHRPSTRLSLRESLGSLLLIAVLVGAPSYSIHVAGWADHLEPAVGIGLVAVAAGWALARSSLHPLAGHALALAAGLSLSTLIYATFLPGEGLEDRSQALVARVAYWLSAAFSGAASTDNLLFAYSMALLAWLIGYGGAWGAFRLFTPWFAIVSAGAGLLLNLSYAPPDLLPLVFVYLMASFLLLMNLNAVGRVAQWRFHEVEHTFAQGTGYALTGAALGFAIVFVAWRVPAGDVSRSFAQGWERVAGPWQDAQATFDRMFASLNPSPLSARGLTAMQSLAPRASFELGDKPVFRVSGRQPAYWRATTYDRYTGQLMTSSAVTGQRRDRRQPLTDRMQTDEGRRFAEYSFLIQAPGSSVLYAPDTPLSISVPSVYEYRGDVRDFAHLRPVVPLRELQQYSLLASVSAASISELRQAGTIYPSWTRPYLQLPQSFPEAVRQEAWRRVGEATTVYDAAANIESYLRSFPYKTRVAVPPPGRDWVSFLLFESREGYCDFYATAMTVMLRSVGIPARVATGYVTGEWDPAAQAFLVSENHAHTWTEVYFPAYGWITFEPSANRPMPPRPEFPLVATTEEEMQRVLEAEAGMEEFLEDEELFDESDFVPLPESGGLNLPLGTLFLVALLVALGGTLVVFTGLWVRDVARFPAFARPYAQVVRLASWCGVAPRPSQTPYEYTDSLVKLLPEAADALQTVGAVYVEGLYGRKEPDAGRLKRMRKAGSDATRRIIQSLGIARAERWLSARLGQLVGERKS